MMDREAFFKEARALLGGKLTQPQVDKFNSLIDEFQGKGMKTSSVGINLISSFEDLKLDAYLCPAGVWTIGFGTTVYPDGTKVKKAIHAPQNRLRLILLMILNALRKPLIAA